MSKDIRVLQIGMSSFPGGIENFIMNYFRKIYNNGIKFDFICEGNKLAYSDEILRYGGHIHYITSSKKNPIKYYKSIKKLIIDNKYDIVHINMLSAANIVPVVAAKVAGAKKIIVHSHNGDIPSGIAKKILHNVNKLFLKKIATHLWACSELAGKFLFGNTDKSISIINNAVEVSKFYFDKDIRKQIRQSLNIQDKFVIGHVGRFAKQKNHSYLIDIFYEIYKIEKNSILVLVGEGNLLQEVRQKVKDYRLEDNVLFLGKRDDINLLYQAFDVFVLPSLFEGLPVVGIEAQVSGLKCILSDSISKEVKICPNVKFEKISSSPNEWAYRVLEYNYDYERDSVRDIFENSQYNIDNAGDKLIDLYSK